MKKIIFMVLLLHFNNASYAAESIFKHSQKKSKDEYKYSKCVDGFTAYREKLSYHEICKYGSSCPSEKAGSKTVMYCTEGNLSECFEKKSWKNANQLVGVNSNVKIGLVTQGHIFKSGTKSGQTCAYYD